MEILSLILETLSADVEMLSNIGEILSLSLLFGRYCFLIFGDTSRRIPPRVSRPEKSPFGFKQNLLWSTVHVQ